MAMEYKKREKMRKNFLYIPVILGLIFSLSSCRSVAPRLDYKALARASVRLGIDIRLEDNHKLYLEAAEGSASLTAQRRFETGTDCSGFTSHIYKKVYHTKLSRSTDGQKKESNKVAKRNLREGDLVFFTSNRSGKKVAHVGIYLKEGKFIHASTTRV